MMNLSKKMWVVAAMATMVAGGSAAQARSTLSFLGSAASDSESSCFTNALGFSSGRVTQSCTGSRRFCVALPVSSSGSKTVRVFGFAPNSSNNAVCKAEGYDKNGVLQGASASVGFSTFGSFASIVLSGAVVDPQGGLSVCCTMAQNTQLGAIDYND